MRADRRFILLHQAVDDRHVSPLGFALLELFDQTLRDRLVFSHHQQPADFAIEPMDQTGEPFSP